jgi:signal transduction histidine kinase
MLIVALYELGPARWIHDRLGVTYHFIAEILIYGTVGPALAYVLLDLLGRWWEERETTELQAQVLGQAQKHIQVDRQLDDDALQNLFAASVLIDSIQADPQPLPPEVAAQLRAADQALKQAIRQLGPHLEQRPPISD